MGIIGCTQGNIELVGFRDIGLRLFKAHTQDKGLGVHLWRISFQEFLNSKPQALNRMPQTSNANPSLGEVIPPPSLRQLGGFCPPTPTIRRTPKIRGTVMGVPMAGKDCSMSGSIFWGSPYLWSQ